MKKLMRSVILLFTIFLGIAIFGNVLFAQGSSLKVDHVATSVEKIKEKVTLLLKFNREKKTDYYLFLSEKRLAELTYAIESDSIDLVEPTASRYATYIGVMTDYTLAKGVTSHKEKMIETLLKQEEILKSLQTKFEFESGWWIAMEHAVNSTKLYRVKLAPF